MNYINPEELPSEKRDEMIDKISKLINRYPGMATAAVFLLEINKPLAYIYGELGRFFAFPFTSFLSAEEGDTFHQYVTVFEQKDNIDLLIKKIEELNEKK